jgi:tetratricopeptide (TPR) repeat protein
MVNKEGITMDLNQVLIEAAKDGNMFVLKAALEKGADIDATDRSGRTALMYADQKGYTQLSDYLREKGAKEEENFAIYYYERGNNYMASGEHQKAIEEYTKAIELDSAYAVFYLSRGLSYYKSGDRQKAIDDYNKTIELDSENADAYFNLGMVYNEIENYQKAIDAYTKVIKLNPKDAQAYSDREISITKFEEYKKFINNRERKLRIMNWLKQKRN